MTRKPKSTLERVEKHRDSAVNIDPDLKAARKRINWRRRRDAEKSLSAWIRTYGIGTFIDDEPSAHGDEILAEMEAAVFDSRPYQILMARGHGKTSYTEACAAYAVFTGSRKLCVVVSMNKAAASQIVDDIFRITENDAFAQDYPDVCLPYELKHGAWKRRQLSGGLDTGAKYTIGGMFLPRVVGNDGKPVATAGGAFIPKALKAVRGTKRGTTRPDLVVLDDLQTTEDASNAETVAKKLHMIRADVMNIGGKKKISIMMTATVIAPDDLAERIASDKGWKTTRFKGMIHWPTDWIKHQDDGLWAEYFRIFDHVDEGDNKNYKGALEFYKAHRDAMDAGAEVLNPKRFDADKWQISGLQHLMDKMHEISLPEFSAEYQMEPIRDICSLELSAGDIVKRVNHHAKLSIPDGCSFVAASTDINPSYALTTEIVAYKPDRTAYVIAHFRHRCSIDQKLNATGYNAAVYEALARLGGAIKDLGIRIDAWGVDASGRQFDAVTAFAKDAKAQFGFPCSGMLGRAAHKLNLYSRSRVSDPINNTVVCGDDVERARRGAGIRYMFWDADLYKEESRRALLSAVGAPGGCSLYNADDFEHDEFAVQVANEKLVGKKPDTTGRDIYIWKTAEPHDYGDTHAMCYAIAANSGISGRVSISSRTAAMPAVAARARKRFNAAGAVTTF